MAARSSGSANLQGQQASAGRLTVSLPGMILLNSKPGGGKSHLARYIFYVNRKKFRHGIVFSKSCFRPGNIDYVPNYEGTPKDVKTHRNFKHMRYNKAVMKAFLDGQAAYPEGKRPLGFVYIDDDISESNMFNDEYMLDAATMYRQYNILLIVCTQHVNKLSTTFRECASQVALFKMDSLGSIKACYESYGQEFEDINRFRSWLFDNTTPMEMHKFCWKDKMNDRPWEVLVAPRKIPFFRFDYGRIEKVKKVVTNRKRKRQGRRERKQAAKRPRESHPVYDEFAALGHIASAKANAVNPTAEVGWMNPYANKQ